MQILQARTAESVAASMRSLRKHIPFIGALEVPPDARQRHLILRFNIYLLKIRTSTEPRPTWSRGYPNNPAQSRAVLMLTDIQVAVC